MNKDIIDKIEAQIAAPEEAASQPQRTLIASLPESIIALCELIRTDFADTASMLRDNANTLRMRANDLDARADKLEDASPIIREDIQKWTAYEEDSRAMVQRLGVILTGQRQHS